MAIVDPIADMLTRIRNAVRNRSKKVDVLNSKVCRGIAGVLKDEGYIDAFDVVEDGRQGLIRLKLRYGPSGEAVLHSLSRHSNPGCRRYAQVADIPKPVQGLGIAIVSTSQGVLSDRVCREKRVGGELLCTID